MHLNVSMNCAHATFCQKLTATSSTVEFTKNFQKETEWAPSDFSWSGVQSELSAEQYWAGAKGTNSFVSEDQKFSALHSANMLR